MLFFSVASIAFASDDECTDRLRATKDLPGGTLTTSYVCVPKHISGGSVNVFRGPSIHTVADKKIAGTIYLSWTEDLPFGFEDDGSEGRVHISKAEIHEGAAATLVKDTAFDGFMRSGGIDMTDDGVVATLCGKYDHDYGD